MNYPKSYVYEQIKNKARGHLYYLKYDADKVIAELEMNLAAAKLVLRIKETK